MNGPTQGQLDTAIAAAKSLPDLIAKLATLDPALAQQLQSKALVQSKSVWGPLVATALTVASARYGLGWSEGFTEIAAGLVLLLASAACRAITRSPIGGLFTTKGPPP